MITAEEARNLMPKYDIFNDYYPELNNLIKSAAEKGDNHIEYNNISFTSCFDRLVASLIKLGYTYEKTLYLVDSYTDRVKYTLKIKW